MFNVCVSLAQLYMTLCDPMDCSLLGFSVHEILQARILEWDPLPFSRGSYLIQGWNPGLLHCRQILYNLNYEQSPMFRVSGLKEMPHNPLLHSTT